MKLDLGEPVYFTRHSLERSLWTSLMDILGLSPRYSLRDLRGLSPWYRLTHSLMVSLWVSLGDSLVGSLRDSLKEDRRCS